jgi:hypothetical protein
MGRNYADHPTINLDKTKETKRQNQLEKLQSAIKPTEQHTLNNRNQLSAQPQSELNQPVTEYGTKSDDWLSANIHILYKKI